MWFLFISVTYSDGLCDTVNCTLSYEEEVELDFKT